MERTTAIGGREAEPKKIPRFYFICSLIPALAIKGDHSFGWGYTAVHLDFYAYNIYMAAECLPVSSAVCTTLTPDEQALRATNQPTNPGRAHPRPAESPPKPAENSV